MKNFKFIYVYLEKSTGIIRIDIYEYQMQFNPELLIAKLNYSKLLLDNSLYKLYNNIDYSLYTRNQNRTTILDMNMHRDIIYDIYGEIINYINLFIPIYYITTGLVITLGILIVKWVKSHNNVNKYKCDVYYKSNNFNFYLFYDRIRVFTSGIPSIISGPGAGGDDGDEGDKNWHKYEQNKKKRNERNRLRQRIKELRSSIYNNNRMRDALIEDLSQLTSEIEANRIYWQSRDYILPEEENYNILQLERWNARSITINRRLDAIGLENEDLNRELADLESVSITNILRGRRR